MHLQLLKSPISEIFENEGEEAFRTMETQVLDEVHSYVKMIVATGGGTVKEKRVSHSGTISCFELEAYKS
jgi:shikimate kinase